MKKHWLRGMLLGVSLALLLSGGAALAQQQLTASIDKDCLPCWPGYFGPGAEITDEYIATLTIKGVRLLNTLKIGRDARLCVQAQSGQYDDYFCMEVDTEDSVQSIAAGCGQELCYWDGTLTEDPADCFEFYALGQWTLGFWQEEGSNFATVAQPPDTMEAEVTFLLAEVCEVEFVPEPGTIALLGSGLAGLAGYAALRWRARS